MKRFVLVLLTLIVLALFAQAGYVLFNAYQNDLFDDATRARLEAEQAARRAAMLDILRVEASNISEHNIQQGFWYAQSGAHGGEDIFYFDVNELARQGVSDDELRRLIAEMEQSRIVNDASMRVLRNSELPSNLQFHNSVYTFGETGNIFTLQNELEWNVRKNQHTEDDLFRLGYLLELKGDYEGRDAIRAQSCEEFGTNCKGGVSVTLTGSVVSGTGDPVQGAVVSVLSKPGTPVVRTDEDGVFSVTVDVRQLEKVRVSAIKRNFSDGIASVVIATTKKRDYQLDPIVIESPINIVTVDLKKGTVTGEGNAFSSGGESIMIRTENSTYIIPHDAVVYKDGSEYNGVYEVYLYEFTKETVPEGLITVDTFDAVVGYAGDLMKTFGMPYIQFFSPDGEELHVRASNPMKLTYQIPHMQELYNNTDQIYRALTVSDMDKLVAATVRSTGYPITREFLIENNLIHFPAFWVFDRRAGVWESIGIRVNNSDGEIESLFYTVNDN